MNVKTDPHIAPLLREAANGRPDLLIFGRKPASNMYVNMAVLDKTNQRLFWFTRYGAAYDSVQLKGDEYDQIASNTVDAFSFYKELCLKNEACLDDAVTEYRRLGKLALKDTSYNRRIIYNAAAVKAAHSTLQQLMALEGLFRKQRLKACLFNCVCNSLSNNNEEFLLRKSLAGKILNKRDTTVYYSISPLELISKIALHEQDSLKMFVFDGRDRVVDSMPLKPGKYASLLKSKEDVFLLYRGWLELQSQQVQEAIRQINALLHRKDAGLYIQAYRVDNSRELLSAVAQLKSQQQDIQHKIDALTLPEDDIVKQMIQNSFPEGAKEITYLSAGMGFAYTASYRRGEKAYELSNHLGNVMVMVRDKKAGVDNGDGAVSYYNVDVVNSNDYYPFGSLVPGRSYNSDNAYRYGFNGKENDDDVKGNGNQQDYGMRVYDPRIGRFLSVDPITARYPELTPYQFASDRPIDGIDRDGLEYAEYVHPQQVIRRNMHTMTRKEAQEYEDRGNRIGALTVGGALLTGIGAAYGSATVLFTLTRGATLLSSPTNQMVLTTTTGFLANLLNPDPGTHVDFPGYGDEIAEEISLVLKNNDGRLTKFFAQAGAKFANKSEWSWAKKLLDEGNNVSLMKDIPQTATVSVRNSDLLVNGVETEIKELSNMTPGPNFLRNLVNKIRDATGQAGSVIIDGTKQKGFTQSSAEEALEAIKNKGVKVTTTFRMVGDGFDFSKTISASK